LIGKASSTAGIYRMYTKTRISLLFILLVVLQTTAMEPFIDSKQIFMLVKSSSSNITRDNASLGTEHLIQTRLSPDFQFKPKWLWSESNEVLLSLTLGDFDGDQQLDPVVGASSNVFAIDGRTGDTIWNNTDPVGPVYSLAVGNLDGDGTDDVVAGGWDNNVTAIRGVTGNLLWKFGGKNESDPQDWIRTIIMADFNGDGIDDIIAGSDDWHVYCVDGTDGTLLWRRPEGEIVMNVPYSITTGDLDNDTYTDIIIGDGSNVYGYRGVNGQLLWQNNDPDARVLCLLAADINNDLLVEVIAASDDGKIYVLEGMTGHEIWQFTVGGVIQSVTLGDFDGNTKQNDLLIGSYNHTVYVLDGIDGVELWRNIEVGGWVQFVRSADFNKDSISDAVVWSDNNVISVIDGMTAEIVASIPTINNINELIVTDVEEDGFLDLIFTDGMTLRCFTMGGEIQYTETTSPIVPTSEFEGVNSAPILILAILSLLVILKRKRSQYNNETTY